MTKDHDELFEALARLRRIPPATQWESRVRARCHSLIDGTEPEPKYSSQLTCHHRLPYAMGFIDVAAAACLFGYLLAVGHEAARLGGLL